MFWKSGLKQTFHHWPLRNLLASPRAWNCADDRERRAPKCSSVGIKLCPSHRGSQKYPEEDSRQWDKETYTYLPLRPQLDHIDLSDQMELRASHYLRNGEYSDTGSWIRIAADATRSVVSSVPNLSCLRPAQAALYSMIGRICTMRSFREWNAGHQHKVLSLACGLCNIFGC